MRTILLALTGLFIWAAPLSAQASRADSAAVLLDAARDLDASGRRDLALELYRWIRERYAGTEAARQADSMLASRRAAGAEATGRTELMVWMTLNGAFLGVTIPAALDADEPEPYGAGLLAMTPAGLLAARAFANATRLTTGEARAIIFGSQWGTWQGFALREILDLGDRTEEFCFQNPPGPDVCERFQVRSERAPYAGAVIGNLVGVAAGAVLGRALRPSAGDATLVNHAAYWGTWFGFGSWVLTGQGDDGVDDEDGVLGFLVVGGNGAALLAGALTSKSDWSPARVRLVSVAGVAGLAVGGGMDLLFDVQDEKAAVAIPMVTSALGLVTAAILSRQATPETRAGGGAPPALALVSVDRGLSVGLPVPMPARAAGRPALHVPLFHGRF